MDFKWDDRFRRELALACAKRMAQETPEDYDAFVAMYSPEFCAWVRHAWTPEFHALSDYAKTPECRKATDFFLRFVERLGDLIEIPHHDLQ